jgi:hypothetical protein
LNQKTVLIAIALLAVSCKGKKTTTGPAELPPPSIAESILSKISSQPFLTLKGKGTYRDQSANQNFRFDIRIQNEDRILAEVSDPILGLRVARLYADGDTFLFINRMEKTYIAGNSTDISRLAGIEIRTDDLIRLVKALPVRWNAHWKPETEGHELIHLYSIIPIDQTDHLNGELFVSGFDFKIRKQILSGNPYWLMAAYDYTSQSETIAPRMITFTFKAKGIENHLILSNDRVSSEYFEIKIPEIPNGYTPVRW